MPKEEYHVDTNKKGRSEILVSDIPDFRTTKVMRN